MNTFRSFAHRSRLALLSLAALAAGCAAPTEEDAATQSSDAIVGGRETLDHPAVGLLLDVTDQAKGSYGICTGTLVGRRTVLTAAHCLDHANRVRQFLLQSATGAVTRANVVATKLAPGYETLPETGVTIEQFFANPDIAIATIDKDLGVAPVPIVASAPYLGEPATLVGYGATAAGATDAGQAKREASNVVLGVEDDHVTFKYVPYALGVSCGGDSGGPALVRAGAGEAVIAVTHFGDCSTFSGYTRADAFAGWIQQASGGDARFLASAR